MGIDYKQKYLKYKIKYLNAKKIFKGGRDLEDWELEELVYGPRQPEKKWEPIQGDPYGERDGYRIARGERERERGWSLVDEDPYGEREGYRIAREEELRKAREEEKAREERRRIGSPEWRDAQDRARAQEPDDDDEEEEDAL